MSHVLFGLVAGLAFGIVVVALMIPHQFPDKRAALTAAFLDRFAIGFVIGVIDLSWPRWIVGVAVGLLLSAPSAVITKAWRPILGIGAIGGLIIALIMPHIDYFGWPVAHRAITHSVTFALVSAVVATLLFFRGPPWTEQRGRIAATLGLALLSHSCLDALSTYSYGLEFLAPFSEQRYRFAWTPLGNPSGSLTAQLVQEMFIVLLPAVLLGWLGFKIRSRALPAKAA